MACRCAELTLTAAYCRVHLRAVSMSVNVRSCVPIPYRTVVWCPCSLNHKYPRKCPKPGYWGLSESYRHYWMTGISTLCEMTAQAATDTAGRGTGRH